MHKQAILLMGFRSGNGNQLPLYLHSIHKLIALTARIVKEDLRVLLIDIWLLYNHSLFIV